MSRPDNQGAVLELLASASEPATVHEIADALNLELKRASNALFILTKARKVCHVGMKKVGDHKAARSYAIAGARKNLPVPAKPGKRAPVTIDQAPPPPRPPRARCSTGAMAMAASTSRPAANRCDSTGTKRSRSATS